MQDRKTGYAVENAVTDERTLDRCETAGAGKVDWTEREALALIGAMHIGIETAGSPLASINELGPAVIAANFGSHGRISCCAIAAPTK